MIVQVGLGQASVAPAAGVTLNSEQNRRKLSQQWSGVSLIKRAANTWVLFGSLVD